MLAVLRYVERNSLRAGLGSRNKPWAWNSLMLHGCTEYPPWFLVGPVARGQDWPRHVAEPQTEAELVALRRSVNRGTPLGSESRQKRTIAKLGLESTLCARGRPRKTKQ